jgi:1,2-diacylglycerol 3-beta-galactosyltransferase
LKRVLILTADAGFGHRRAADALAAAFADMSDPQCRAEVVNPLNDPRTPVLLRDSQTDYDRLIRENPGLYQLGYRASEETLPNALIEGGLTVLLFDILRKLLKKYEPDLVVVTFPLYQSTLAALAALGVCKAPFVTVVTDLTTVHRTWFNHTASLLFVPTPVVYQHAVEHGVSAERIRIAGIPVNPALQLEQRAKPVIRRELGWLEDRFVVLAVGSPRVRHLSEVLHVLNHANLPIQLVVVAGGDAGQYDRLNRISWHIPAHIYNFVTNLHVMMRASDVLISKAGGLIITEALACGLPVLMTEIIPGQETGNAEFIQQHAAGYVLRQPVDVLEALSHWLLHEKERFAAVCAAAADLGRPNAAHEIARAAINATRA